MDGSGAIVEGLERIRMFVVMGLEGLTTEQLAYRPAERANSIAWLAWHLTRSQDFQLAGLGHFPQAWITDGWHARFGMPADPTNWGIGHTPEQVAALRPESPQVLLEYHEAVYPRSVAYVRSLSASDLDRNLNVPPGRPPSTVGQRLVRVLNDNLQHMGQIAYLRGLLGDCHWYPA